MHHLVRVCQVLRRYRLRRASPKCCDQAAFIGPGDMFAVETKFRPGCSNARKDLGERESAGSHHAPSNKAFSTRWSRPRPSWFTQWDRRTCADSTDRLTRVCDLVGLRNGHVRSGRQACLARSRP